VTVALASSAVPNRDTESRGETARAAAALQARARTDETRIKFLMLI